MLGESVTIDGIIIGKDNLGEYLGKAVNYVPNNPSTAYGTSKAYRLFYIDFDGKYSNGEKGTIFLKADCDENEVSLKNYIRHISSDDLKIMGELNPEWKFNSDKDYLPNDKCVAWIADPKVWENWKDKSLSNDIRYVIGSPSLEIYIASYNEYLRKHRDSIGLVEKLKCEYASDDVKYNSKGYRIGFDNVQSSQWVNDGYYQMENSIFSSNIANGMFSTEKQYFWLASPSAGAMSYVMFVDGYSNFISGFGHYKNSKSLCPLVSLKARAKLNWK